MKRLAFVVTIMVALAPAVFAQEVGLEIDPGQLGIDASQQRLVEISVTQFEDPGFWRVSMPRDSGLVEWRRFEGAPADREPLDMEEQVGFVPEEGDRYVLGIRADFFRRGNTQIVIEADRPISIPGIVKTMSVWVVGRNQPHRLRGIIEDQFGHRYTVTFGELNFTGWRRLTAAIPPTVRQRDPNITDREGLRFRGFILEPDLMQTYGNYYVYFDDMRAVTDLFGEELRDPDDMVDGW